MGSPDRPRIRRWRIATAGAVVALASLGLSACGADTTATAPGAAPSGTSTPTLEGLRRDPPLDVSSVTLPAVQADGSETPFRTVAQPGHLLFVYFGYTHCPDLCPTTMADLRKGLKQLGDDAARVDVAFVTVDPERDTADVLPKYVGSFVDGANALRTTDPAALQAAEDAFLASSSITPRDDGTYDVSHTAFSSIVDEHGTVVAEWPFGFSPDSMANDLRILLADIPAAGAATPTTAGPA